MPRPTLRQRAAVLAVQIALLGPAPALLDTSARAEAAPADATYDIPAGDLIDTLARFAQQSHVALSYDADRLKGRTSQGLHGTYGIEQGFDTLLAGSGYAIGKTDAGYTLVPAPVSAPPLVPDEVRLPTVNVNAGADAQNPDGPGVGYVAQRSTVATKTDTPLLVTPQTVSEITRDQMDDQGVNTSVNQAFRYSTGVVTDMNGADTKLDSQTVVRGIGRTEYLDGLPLVNGTFIAAAYDPYMLDRIEILKGPASVLYGQLSPGGLVSYVTKKPTDEPLHEIFTQVGNWGHLSAGFDFSGPLDADHRWLYRLTAVGLDTGSQVDNTRNKRLEIAPSITWKPDAATTFTLMADYRRDPNMGFWNKLPALGTVLPNAAGQIPYDFYSGDLGFNTTSSTQAYIGYQFQHVFNDVWTVRQNLRFQHIGFEFDSVQGDSLSGTSLVRDKFMDESTDNSFVLDNQAQATFDTGPLKHKVLFGLDYQHTVTHDLEADADAPSQDILNPNYTMTLPAYTDSDYYLRNRQSINQVGVYAQDQLNIGHWFATLGVREDAASTSTDDEIANTSSTQHDHAFTWRAGLLYLFDNGIAPYASYSTSFQPTVGTNAYGQAFVPTTGQQYEIGIKYQPKNTDLLVTASLFDIRQQHELTQDPNNPDNSIQTGEVRSRGAELEARANLTEDFKIIASYTYTHAVVAKSNNGDQGYRIYAVPLNAVSAWGEYDLHRGPLAGLGLGLGVRFTGSTLDQSNTERVASFTIVDLALHYDLSRIDPRLRGVTLGLNAQNLLDRKYVQTCVNGCYYGLERSVIATAKYDW
ncbi:TonB-dependent siderophore receptor [Pararobbsia silviterrae]|nr:TonB-dependent siderophore receptor [Pararobbsia silviterrae]